MTIAGRILPDGLEQNRRLLFTVSGLAIVESCSASSSSAIV